jgi:hypothetical protein
MNNATTLILGSTGFLGGYFIIINPANIKTMPVSKATMPILSAK